MEMSSLPPVHDPALSDEADSLYRPLGDLTAWAATAIDDDAWVEAVGGLDGVCRRHAAWSDMVLRGARLAAAHQSGALDGVHGGGRDVAMALLRGAHPAVAAGADAWPHVRANDRALGVAAAGPALTEDVIRQVHEEACRPQLTHRVAVDGRAQDHVFAHGEYKHHPNHVPTDGGGWRARAPVAQVRREMHNLLDALAGPAVSALHPAVRAAFVLYGVSHAAPFADGNGRVARALAGAFLLRAAGIPLLVVAGDAVPYDDALVAAGERRPGDLVRFVLGCSVDLAGVVSGLEVPPAGSQDQAFDRWRREVAVARSLGEALPDAMARALERHRARPDLGWLSSLAAAQVVVPRPDSHEERFDTGPLIVVVPLPGGIAVQETIAVDAHPLDTGGDGEGRVVVQARDAQLRLEVDVGEPADVSSARLRPWLDRVVSTLALRVAAELD